MAVRTPPSWLQASSHPAENDRLTTQALYTTTGIMGADSLKVSQSAVPAMSVSVASGWAAIVGTTQANMGTYVAYNDAALTVAVTASNPTNPRIDIIVATVNDAQYVGVSNNVVIQCVAGTAAASPTAPATPANSILLANIAVAAAATTIINANITDQRVYTTSNANSPTIPVGYATTATAAGTTTLTNASASNQFFTGTTTQTVLLPNTSTMFLGESYTIANFSTGAVAVQTSAGTVIASQSAGQTYTYTCSSTTSNLTSDWRTIIQGSQNPTGTGYLVCQTSPTINSPVISGTTIPAIGLSSQGGTDLNLHTGSTTRIAAFQTGAVKIYNGFALGGNVAAPTASTYTVSRTGSTMVRFAPTATVTVTLPTITSSVSNTNIDGMMVYLMTTTAFAINSASANIFPKTSNSVAGTAILPATAGAWCILVADANFAGWVIMASGT